MAISIDHLHSQSRSPMDNFAKCPEESVVRFLPCLIGAKPEIKDGNVVISVLDNLPKASRKMKNSGWVLSDKVFFTDGREIFLGWLKRPTRGLLDSGRTPYWESADGRIFNTEEVKGWQSQNRIRITIDR